MNWYKKAQEEYKGKHEAPCRENGAPLYNLTALYPDDIYSPQGALYYGHYGQNHPLDVMSISIIKSAKNRPNSSVTIYRAVPNINKSLDTKIKELAALTWYFDQYKFFPIGNLIVEKIGEKYPRDQYTGSKYNERQQLIYQDIKKKIEELEVQKQKPIGINNGDWVTINREYAKEHGESLLKGDYKIVSKTVKAKDIYTDGDSIQEWGYDPT